MKTKVIKGKKGEDLAVEFLKKQGFRIIERNWRYSRMGEIDIIALDDDALVFVEVKARTSVNFGHPIEAVSPAKFATMQQLAEIYISLPKQKGFSDIGKPQNIEESVPPSFPDIESAKVGALENRNTNLQPTCHKNQDAEFKEVRFDIVGILLGKEPDITHIKGIYE